MNLLTQVNSAFSVKISQFIIIFYKVVDTTSFVKSNSKKFKKTSLYGMKQPNQ